MTKTLAKRRLQRKILIWRLKPTQAALSEVTDVTIDKAVDRASGVEIWHTMLVLRTGEGWAFLAADKQDAHTNSAAMREFLKLPA